MEKGVELVGGGSVINEASPSSLLLKAPSSSIKTWQHRKIIFSQVIAM